MNAPRLSLLRKRASRLAAVQAMYSEALIEKSTLPALLANQLLQSWADSRENDTDDMPHGLQPEAAQSTFEPRGDEVLSHQGLAHWHGSREGSGLSPRAERHDY